MNIALVHLNRNRRSYAFLALMGLVVGGVVALLRENAAAELKGPQTNDHFVALAVAKKMETEHLTRHPLDAEISKRTFKAFLKSLDPMKLYFTADDFASFEKSQDILADRIRKGDISFAHTVFHTLLKRIDERMQLVDKLLAPDNKIDLTTDDQIVTDADKTVYAKTPEEMEAKWLKRIKYDLLLQEIDKTTEKPVILKDKDGNPIDILKEKPGKDVAPEKVSDNPEKEFREKLIRRYHSFDKRMHQITNDDLLEMYLTAMTTAFDPHTSYMSASTLENFNILMKAELDGIGASLQFDDGNTIVNELIDGGAAFIDGRLKPKDRVIGVGQGENGEIVDVVDMSLNDVVKLIRGKRGTVVRLKVIPVGKVEPKIYNITRAKIELKNSEARGEILEDGKKANGQPYRLGFIDVPGFYMDMNGARSGVPEFKSVTRDVRKILNEFNEKHVDAVIMDLRRNGGGALNEAISLTGLFIDTGPVVQVKDSADHVQHYDDLESGVAWAGPLVVLQSKFSASASEIFAGAIQDYRRGLIVGDHSSHGKGTVQSMIDVGESLLQVQHAPSLGALKITIQQFYRPDGDSTQRRGVVSDIELPSISSHLPVGEGDLDFALPFDHVDPVRYTPVDMVDPTLVKQLQQLSTTRVNESEDFKKLETNINRYEKQKDRKIVDLNHDKFMAERKDLNADKEEEKEYDQLNDTKRPVVKRDYYINEVLAIATDYLRLSKVKALTAN